MKWAHEKLIVAVCYVGPSANTEVHLLQSHVTRWIKECWLKFHLFLLVSILHQRQCFQLNNTQRSTIHTRTWFSVPEMSLNIDGKKSFHDCWKLLLHYAFISPHWGGREIKLLISNFINSLIYSESHIKQNFALKYLSIPSLLCARYFSKAQENEGIRCSLIYDGNEGGLLPDVSNTSSASRAVRAGDQPWIPSGAPSPFRCFAISMHVNVSRAFIYCSLWSDCGGFQILSD